MVLYACMCCVCVFSLRQKSPDMILGDKPLIYEVVLSQRCAHISCYLGCVIERW
jgi:hypothetical protein